MSDRKLCPLPWVSVETSPFGELRPCCLYDDYIKKDDGTNYNIAKGDSISDAFNSTSMTELRQEFLDGGQPDGCRRCWSEEDAGIISKRLRSVEQYEKQNINFYTNEADKVRFLDLKLGNICNLKCRICGSWSSSKWAAEEISYLKADKNFERTQVLQDQYNYKRKLLKDGAWPREVSAVWTELDSIMENIDLMEFTGGEPMMIQEQFDLLKSAVKNGHSKNIKVHYNTNGTHYVQDAIDNIWPNFKTVELAFSIDDVGQKFEYQRYGANWNEVNQNITNYHKLASESWFASQVCMTFSAFNILSVGNLLEWVDTQPFGHVYFNLMHDPKHFNMKVLPDVAKEKIATKIMQQTINTKHYENVKNLCNFLLQKDQEIEDNKEKYWADFKRHLAQTDKFRNQNFADTFPELYVLIEEWL